MEKIKKLYQKYSEIISYLFFGVLTTAVNYIVYLLLSPLFIYTVIPTVIAWMAAVAFAYVTNRRFVFRSDSKGRELLKEMLKFVGARLLSGAADVLFMWITVDVLSFDGRIMKLLANVFVVVFNYIAGKLIVFKKKSSDQRLP